ncbi:phosphatidic acid phosphatase [Trypanosoma rangeli]|uniref:Phosphatidic acid phosphatase n=1 Tax=Trypanosoma rangeli TaxID=5698 RepID=A0A422MQK2_TRYRA|nr:phosphatidic acid phosphatase [Trypanosoma rangeli]RNE95473.1 phosphatidic acid phosphatase [Trypanosoma rangeli]|eukprot:RNE95473.1 phosphatidic acid phosphatase [Trypanosoma rangeli]
MASFETFSNVLTTFRIVDYLLCAILALTGMIIARNVRPHCRPFSWNDTTIAYDYAGNEAYPSWSLIFIAILPVVVYATVEFIRALLWRAGTTLSADMAPLDAELNPVTVDVAGQEGTTVRRLRVENVNSGVPGASEGEEGREGTLGAGTRWSLFTEKLNHWVLAQAFAVCLCLCIVDVTKVYAGRLRPDFLARLLRAGYNKESEGVDWCYVALGGRKSFPSGHSGVAFASVVTLVLYCLGQLQAFHFASLWRTVMSLLLLILPIAVAVSRTRDNRHHFSDILAGSVIGTCCALFSVTLLFRLSGRTGFFLPRRLDYALKR